jgi:hypothetical protein
MDDQHNSRQNNGIGVRQESSLHAAVKSWCAGPGDGFEVAVDGYQIDLICGDQLVEVQTGNFTALRPKLGRLLANHPVRLVYPVAQEKWICRVNAADRPVSRRKSPKRGRVEELFSELVRIPRLVTHPNFSLEVLLVTMDEIWRDDGQGSWRRRHWSIADRRLLEVVESRLFQGAADYLSLVPDDLPHPFTNRALAERLGISRRLAEQMTYCLRAMDMLAVVGRDGRANLFAEVR